MLDKPDKSPGIEVPCAMFFEIEIQIAKISNLKFILPFCNEQATNDN